ncbi:hypothetical protein H9L39_17804 [Fusarium oxysporum f. sp. albedinis]|nr:hypothetical protein H9L39_17804 [Fusarium oxysporum f. sp. albedinis]
MESASWPPTLSPPSSLGVPPLPDRWWSPTSLPARCDGYLGGAVSTVKGKDLSRLLRARYAHRHVHEKGSSQGKVSSWGGGKPLRDTRMWTRFQWLLSILKLINSYRLVQDRHHRRIPAQAESSTVGLFIRVAPDTTRLLHQKIGLDTY